MIKLLNTKYDLTLVDDVELATIMKDQCETFIQCKYEMSTAILEAWDRIDIIAKEIARRNDTLHI